MFAASEQTRDLHYQGAGVEILVDPTAVEAGRPLPVLLHATSPGRFVLFGVEGEELYDLRVIHLEGSDELIEIEMQEHFVPNVFLSALSIGELMLEADREELSVPPTRQILDIRVAADREEYRPGEKGLFTVTSRDAEGQPVSSEIALAVSDESVFAIQGELAEDPRAFFHGRNRPPLVQTGTSLDRMAFAAWLEGDEDLPEATSSLVRDRNLFGSKSVKRHIDLGRMSKEAAPAQAPGEPLRALGYAVADAE